MPDGWLPHVRRVSSPNADARPAGTDIDLIVLHAISLPPGEFGGPFIGQLFTNRLDRAAHPYFANLHELRVSAHFLLARDGGATQFVDIYQRAWHAGESSWAGRARCNDYSIGIELEGSDELPFTNRQYVALAGLIAELRARMPTIAPARIVGHCDVAPGRKSDPGPCFDWQRMARSLGA